jgi:hypothetical protein
LVFIDFKKRFAFSAINLKGLEARSKSKGKISGGFAPSKKLNPVRPNLPRFGRGLDAS